MQVTRNTTPFPAERFVATDKDGRRHCVLVVKASFDVAADGHCRPSEEQAKFVYTDEHHGDPALTSIRHESDFAPTKPCADVLLDGCAVAPGNRPATEVEVALAGPGLLKRAIVAGDREWTRGMLGMVASSPRPFDAMPLSWDRAFGGVDLSSDDPRQHGCERRNPTGKGWRMGGDALRGSPLPNIEAPDQRMRAWSDKPEPIGFGPVGRGWLPRSSFAGTYDERWMNERRPFLPLDFDARYFQSAPQDQQLARLDEGMAFQCLHMNRAGRFMVRLPDLRIPVRFVFDTRLDAGLVRPDTLILRPEAGRITMLGRISAPLGRKLTALREIEVGREPYRAPVGKRHFPGLAAAVRHLRSRG